MYFKKRNIVNKMSFFCVICGKGYSYNRNLNRHIKEKHSPDLIHFKCVIRGCRSKFIRQSNLTKHLKLIHNLSNETVQQLFFDVVLETNNSAPRNTLHETCVYEDIFEADKHPYEDVSDTDFEQWLDETSKSHTYLEDLQSYSVPNLHVTEEERSEEVSNNKTLITACSEK
jgi:hypothetical protein